MPRQGSPELGCLLVDFSHFYFCFKDLSHPAAVHPELCALGFLTSSF